MPVLVCCKKKRLCLGIKGNYVLNGFLDGYGRMDGFISNVCLGVGVGVVMVM